MLYMSSVLPISVIRANFLLYLLGFDVVLIVLFWGSGLFVWDIAVLGLLAGVPNVMIMNTQRAKDLGIQSVPDFVRYAKAHPGQLNMASSGNEPNLGLNSVGICRILIPSEAC